jgi:hypothetical protein
MEIFCYNKKSKGGKMKTSYSSCIIYFYGRRLSAEGRAKPAYQPPQGLQRLSYGTGEDVEGRCRKRQRTPM